MFDLVASAVLQELDPEFIGGYAVESDAGRAEHPFSQHGPALGDTCPVSDDLRGQSVRMDGVHSGLAVFVQCACQPQGRVELQHGPYLFQGPILVFIDWPFTTAAM